MSFIGKLFVQDVRRVTPSIEEVLALPHGENPRVEVVRAPHIWSLVPSAHIEESRLLSGYAATVILMTHTHQIATSCL